MFKGMQGARKRRVLGCQGMGVWLGKCWGARQGWHQDGPDGSGRGMCVGPLYQRPSAALCWQAVVRTQGFHELSDVVLARVLRSDRLAVDELDLVQAVREWAHVSSVSATHGHGGVVMDGVPRQAEPPRGAQDITNPIPYIPLSRRLSWSAQCLRWLPCLCRSCACPCWHPVSWQRWRAKTSGICSFR